MTIPEEIKQLEIKLENTADEREQAEVLVELLKKYNSINSTDTHTHIDRLLQLAEKLNNPLYKASGYYYFARLKYLKAEYDVSLDSFQQSLSLFEQIRDRKGTADSYNNIGVVRSKQGNYLEALKKSFHFFENKRRNRRQTRHCVFLRQYWDCL